VKLADFSVFLSAYYESVTDSVLPLPIFLKKLHLWYQENTKMSNNSQTFG